MAAPTPAEVLSSTEFERPKNTAFLSIAVILLGGSILVLGNGLQSTLLGVRASIEQISTTSVGIMMSSYFVGYGAGSRLSPYFVRTVGHIRSFAAFAAILSATSLAYLLVVHPIFWTLLRVIQGICYGGMILVIETWLNSNTSSSDRGKILSTYQGVLLAAWVGSQLLLNVASAADPTLFSLVSILLSLSLVPMALTRVEQPHLADPHPVKLSRIYHVSPIAFAGAFVSGISFNCYATMAPLYGAERGLSTYWISLLVSLMLLGGFLLQWPIGRWSDRIDRRKVILMMAISSGLSLLAMSTLGSHSLGALLAFSFLFGAFSLALYPVCIAHINDFVSDNERVGTASGLILTYSIGAIIGPLSGGFAMTLLGPPGLFYFMTSVQLAFAVFGYYRYQQRIPVAADLKEDFVAVPRTTHAVLALNERLGSNGSDSSNEQSFES